MPDEGRSAEVPDCLAIIGELIQRNVVVSRLDARPEGEAPSYVILIIHEGLKRLRDKVLMKVREHRIQTS